jgi:hypothetical protein
LRPDAGKDFRVVGEKASASVALFASLQGMQAATRLPGLLDPAVDRGNDVILGQLDVGGAAIRAMPAVALSGRGEIPACVAPLSGETAARRR